MGLQTKQSAGEVAFEQIQYCSICSQAFDVSIEGDKGMIGLIPFAFCGTCRAGVVEYVEGAHDSVDV